MSLLAIVGRPNVGKSTLFNRLVGMRQAIVDETAGVTRDRHYGRCEWCGHEFSVVDTGGYTSNSDDIFEEEIRKQVLIAVEEADVVLFLVDVQNGVTDLDMQVASILRRAKTPVILVSNKTDNYDLQYNAAEFYSLGLGDPFCVSALTGSGTGDLLDMVIENQTLRIATGVLNEIMMEAVAMQQPPSDKGKRLKLYYITQVSVKPPTFVIFVNDKELMHFSYTRYLENKIREAFGFKGTSLKFFIRERKEKEQ